MSITAAQKAAAQSVQSTAAQDPAPQVMVVAGPGTGKSHAILMRVAHILGSGATPGNLYVISFTRATCAELRDRISAHLSQASTSLATAASRINVSTMHSLALSILRRGNQLGQYPSDPVVLDGWEQKHVYDAELADFLGCTPTRAKEIREAHDAGWHTLNPAAMAQAQVTQAEKHGFDAFHSARTNLYSCVLPGEIIYKCVDALRLGSLAPAQLPRIEHLIVDEFQDLNACDQEFVKLLCAQGAILFIAGDDQSIYSSLRHADPDGMVQFQTTYPSSTSHVLSACFRCTPSILDGASQLILHNPSRLPKTLVSLYASAAPVVTGDLLVWSFPTADIEARAIAESCRRLINAGLAGREDEIVILVSNRRVQLGLLAQELGNLGLPYDSPRDTAFAEDPAIRAVYCLLRIARDQATTRPDYPAHRALLSLLYGVGPSTARAIGDLCVQHSQNFRNLFYLTTPVPWLTGRSLSAVMRLSSVVQAAGTWNMTDTLAVRMADINALLSTFVFTNPGQSVAQLAYWTALAGALPSQMTLDELVEFLGAPTESDQQSILEAVNKRITAVTQQTAAPPQKRIRILTMHGAKGLSGKIVFIPSAEQGIVPSFRSLQATGLVIEQRRLFYVSMTRAMAACVISHAAVHTGPAAFALRQQPNVRLTRSQFLNEMGAPSTNRTGGLTAAEAVRIVTDINNL